MQAIALTGGTGFLGRHLSRALSDAGYGVRCLTRSEHAPPNTRGFRGELGDDAALREFLNGAAAVVHLAAATRGGSPARFQAVNVAGTRHLIDAAAQAGCRRFVYISTDLAELACEPYGVSKREAEGVLAESELAWTVLRFPALYGTALSGRPSVAQVLTDKVRAGRVIVPGTGRQRLSLLHTADACEAIVRALRSDDTIGRTYFVGPPAVPLDDAIRAIAGGAGVDAKILHIPWTAVRGMVSSALGVFRALPVDVTTLLTIDRDKVLDGSPFERAVDWRPTDVEEGLRRYAAGAAAMTTTTLAS